MAVNSLYPQTGFLDDTGRPNRVWQLYLQSIETNTLENAANAGVLKNTVNTLFNQTLPAEALPAMPAGYTVITVNGTRFKVPYYTI